MSKPTIGRRALLTIGSLALVAVGVGACQTYNFEPFNPSFYKQYVQVVGAYRITVKPNVMIVFDKSGSMNDKACDTCGGSKIEEARSAMVTFMQNSGTLARFGLTFYPDTAVNSTCGAPANQIKVTVDFPPASVTSAGLPTDENTDGALTINATNIREAIQKVTPNGGTPTATVFEFLETYQGLSGADLRPNYVLLVTDGLPNCNPTNPPLNPDSNPNNVCKYASEKWRTTFSNPPPTSETDPQKIADFNEIKTALDKCDCQSGAPITCLNTFECSSGCLNVPPTAARISKLRTKNIKTIVVGFGAVTGATTAYNGLSAMARAGGFPRSCPNGTDAECGAGDTCDQQTRVCSRPFYQVTSGAELASTLQKIIEALPEPCQFLLQAQPSDPSLLAVIVNGTAIPPGTDTWNYNAGKVTFEKEGKICKDIEAASNAQPVKVEFRILQQVR